MWSSSFNIVEKFKSDSFSLFPWGILQSGLCGPYISYNFWLHAIPTWPPKKFRGQQVVKIKVPNENMLIDIKLIRPITELTNTFEYWQVSIRTNVHSDKCPFGQVSILANVQSILALDLGKIKILHPQKHSIS